MTSYVPDFSEDVCSRDLAGLLRGGRLACRDLERRVERLRGRYRAFVRFCPVPAWAPGLAVSAEMANIIDGWLPGREIAAAFRRLLKEAFIPSPRLEIAPFSRTFLWAQTLPDLEPFATSADPAALLSRLMDDEKMRRDFIFSLFLPPHYGCSFGRYPEQPPVIRGWLADLPGRGRLRCLDAACGTGEGTYELAALLLAEGLAPDSFLIHGMTLDPVEVFAAAHGYFPHDPRRQELFRQAAEPAVSAGAAASMGFFAADVSERWAGEEYDLILCNGLLGGPFSSGERLDRTVAVLAEKLGPGGLLLAENRFHEGWRRREPNERLAGLFRRHGLVCHAAGKGIACIRGG